jgi:hypothetical protein
LGLRTCSAQGCYRVEHKSLKMKRCAGCAVAHFCSRECQVLDWKQRYKHVCANAKVGPCTS